MQEDEICLLSTGVSLLRNAWKCMLAGGNRIATRYYLPAARAYLQRGIDSREWTREEPSPPSPEYGEFDARSRLDMVNASTQPFGGHYLIRRETVELLNISFAQHVRSFHGKAQSVPRGTEYRAIMRACAAGSLETALNWWHSIQDVRGRKTAPNTPLGRIGTACIEYARLALRKNSTGARAAIRDVYDAAIRWHGALWEDLLVEDVVVLAWLLYAGLDSPSKSTIESVTAKIANDTLGLYRPCCVNQAGSRLAN